MIRKSFRVGTFIVSTAFLGVCVIPINCFSGDIRALSDVYTIPPARDIECPTTGIDAASKPPVAIPLKEVFARIDKALRETSDNKALRMLTESEEARDPAAASNLAVVALADHMPEAALALLLHANQTAPKEPATLVNLAAMLNYLGDYGDALSAIAAAEKMPAADSVQASLLTNKGNALLGLGRPQDAQLAAAAAIKLSPDLPEAYTTMAYAQGDQGKCDQAVRFLRVGARRQPLRDMVEATESDPKVPSPVDEITHLPVMNAVDLSRGLTDRLPRVTYGKTYGEVKAAFDEWSNSIAVFQERLVEASMEEAKGEEAAWDIHNRWKKTGRLSDEMTAYRAQFLIRMLKDEIGSHTPEYEDFSKAEKKREAGLVRVAEKGEADFMAAIANSTQQSAGCSALVDLEDRDACDKRVDAELKQSQCAAMTEAIAQEGAVLSEFEHRADQYYGDIYHRATAIAANFSEPTYHAYATDIVEAWRLGFYSTAHPVGLGLWYSEEYCKTPESEQAQIDALALSDNRPPICREVGNKTKIAAKAGVVEVGVNCEKVEVKVSTPGPLGIFAQAEYEGYNPVKKLTDPKERYIERSRGGNPDRTPNLRQWGATFDGKLTIYTGAQAGVSAAGVSHEVNGGYSVTVDGNGNVSDAGWKSSGSTKVSVGVEAAGVGVAVETEISSAPIRIPSFVSSPSGLAAY